MNKYQLTKNGVFFSIQGEGHLRGFQMAFLRLAGCSVGCPGCDTDYTANESLTPIEVAQRLKEAMPDEYRDQWVWITGGEPYDRDLLPLLKVLKQEGFSIAVATSGKHRAIHSVDWISVSYHGAYPLVQKYGHEIKLVEGLNGLDLWEFEKQYPDDQTDFFYRYVQPLSVDGAEDKESMQRCLEFIKQRPNWSLSRQDHIVWGVA